MHLKPLVSVVIPAFNRQAYIGQCVQSVLGQTYPDLEVIVIDDGSTDRTRLVVEALVRSDSRVRYIWQVNSERSVARNTGIRNARGKYVAFLDSDDRWLPEKLELQIDLLERSPDIVMAACWFELFDDQEGTITPCGWPSEEDAASADFPYVQTEYNLIGSPCPVIRKEVFGRAGMFAEDPGLICFEDWELWTRVACFGRVGVVPQILACHRIHPGNTEKPIDEKTYLKVTSHLIRHGPPAATKRLRQAACDGYWIILRSSKSSGIRNRVSSIVLGYVALQGDFVMATLKRHLRDLFATLVGDSTVTGMRSLFTRRNQPSRVDVNIHLS